MTFAVPVPAAKLFVALLMTSAPLSSVGGLPAVSVAPGHGNVWIRLFGETVTRKIALLASGAEADPELIETAPPASVYARPPQKNSMTAMIGTMTNPTPGAGTSVIGVPNSARMFAELSVVVVVESTTPGRSAATRARNVGGAAPPVV